MSLERSQSDTPQEQPNENQETAKNALKMADFQIGENVAIPFPENYPTGAWIVFESTTLITEGREISAVIIHNPDSSSYITLTLEELCSANPAPRQNKQPNPYHETLVTYIGSHLTDNKTTYLHKVVDGKEEKIFMGRIDHTIKVGESIRASLLSQPTSIVTKITLEGNRYKITIESGSVYYFNPSDSHDAYQTD